MASHTRQPEIRSDTPTCANFANNHFTVGAGVAIFHVASSRVVVCFHGRDKYWFLPKGRRDVHESTEQAAEREGYEEVHLNSLAYKRTDSANASIQSGYRNRVLPIPIQHRQPQPRIPLDPRFSAFAAEPIWVQLVPQTPTSQYILYWYIAETLSPLLEETLNKQEDEAENTGVFGAPYQYPPKFPLDLTLKKRVAMDPKGWAPSRHSNTSADDEEAMYESYLLPISEAVEKLGLASRTVQADVVQRGWNAIMERLHTET